MGKRDKTTKNRPVSNKTDDLIAKKKTNEKPKSNQVRSEGKKESSNKWIYVSSISIAVLAVLPSIYLQYISNSQVSVSPNFHVHPERAGYDSPAPDSLQKHEALSQPAHSTLQNGFDDIKDKHSDVDFDGKTRNEEEKDLFTPSKIEDGRFEFLSDSQSDTVEPYFPKTEKTFAAHDENRESTAVDDIFQSEKSVAEDFYHLSYVDESFSRDVQEEVIEDSNEESLSTQEPRSSEETPANVLSGHAVDDIDKTEQTSLDDSFAEIDTEIDSENDVTEVHSEIGGGIQDKELDDTEKNEERVQHKVDDDMDYVVYENQDEKLKTEEHDGYQTPEFGATDSISDDNNVEYTILSEKQGSVEKADDSLILDGASIKKHPSDSSEDAKNSGTYKEQDSCDQSGDASFPSQHSVVQVPVKETNDAMRSEDELDDEEVAVTDAGLDTTAGSHDDDMDTLVSHQNLDEETDTFKVQLNDLEIPPEEGSLPEDDNIYSTKGEHEKYDLDGVQQREADESDTGVENAAGEDDEGELEEILHGSSIFGSSELLGKDQVLEMHTVEHEENMKIVDGEPLRNGEDDPESEEIINQPPDEKSQHGKQEGSSYAMESTLIARESIHISDLDSYQKESEDMFVNDETKMDDEGYLEVSNGVKKKIVRAGTGPKVSTGDVLTIHCIGYLDKNPRKKFWSTKDPGQRPFTFAVGKRQVIKGWDEGAASMRLHERSKILIEPVKAYGKYGFEAWGIPANSRIILEMDVINVKRMKKS